MPRTSTPNLDSFVSLAAFGQAVLDLVKDSGLAKAKPRKKRADAGKPRRKRRTKAEMAAARAAEAAPRRRPIADEQAE